MIRTLRSLALLGALLILPRAVDAQDVARLHSKQNSGTLAANGDYVELNTTFYATLRLDIVGSMTGTVTVSCSVDGGTTFRSIPIYGPEPAESQDADGAVTVGGQYKADVSGCEKVRATASGWSAGTPVVTMRAISVGGGSSSGGGGGVVDTELPSAAALADDTPNPTVPGVAAFMMCYDGTNWDRCQSTRDPCDGAAKTVIPINISTATTTELTASLAGGSNYYYVCSINLGPTAGAQNFALVDDDTDNCVSVTAGMAGGTTAGTGWNFAANGGIVLGNGQGTVAKTNGTNRVICAVTSAAVQISGVITVVAAP